MSEQRRHRIRVAIAAAALLVAGATGIVQPAPASVAPVDGAEFSTDGTAWSAEAPAALFASAFRYAPGDSRASTVYVRNTHGTAIRIAAVITRMTWSSADAATAFTVAGADQDGVGMFARPIGAIGNCTPLVPTRQLAPGEILEITTTVALLASTSGTTAQGSSIRFDVELAMTDMDGPAPSPGCGAQAPEQPGGETIPNVPGTGGTAANGALGATGVGAHLAPTIAVAATAGALGLLFMLWARRRRERRDAEIAEPVAPLGPPDA